jgi:hypothetical protein
MRYWALFPLASPFPSPSGSVGIRPPRQVLPTPPRHSAFPWCSLWFPFRSRGEKLRARFFQPVQDIPYFRGARCGSSTDQKGISLRARFFQPLQDVPYFRGARCGYPTDQKGIKPRGPVPKTTPRHSAFAWRSLWFPFRSRGDRDPRPVPPTPPGHSAFTFCSLWFPLAHCARSWRRSLHWTIASRGIPHFRDA